MEIQVKQQNKKYWLAHIISILFHPLFIPTYLAAFLIYVHPYAYAGMDEKGKLFSLLTVFNNTCFIPGFFVFVLWRLKFIQSVFLRTQKDRIIPYIAAMIFYFWVWYVYKNKSEAPPAFIWMLLSTFLSSIVALMANIYCKISMHAIAIGNVLVFFILLSISGDASLEYLMLAVLVSGLVLSARLLVSDHTSFEVYLGFFLGALCHYLAAWWVV